MIPRVVAIVPAAGHSRRMGQPKLLLKLGEMTVMARVVEALREAGITKIVVVVRPDDPALAEEVERAGADLIQPATAPPDMRASVEIAIVTQQGHGEVWDGWMLIPADHPTLDSSVIRQLVADWTLDSTRIAVPTWDGQRGHPTLFPWSTAAEVSQLPSNVGLNFLLRSRPDRVVEIPACNEEVLADLDTPEDWERIRNRRSGN